MKSAVVILNWNTKEYLRRFLPALLRSVEGHDAEVIVADSASGDGSMKMMKEEFPSVRRIELDGNYGFTGGYNRALAQVEAEYYILLNSDIEVSDNWLAPLEDWMDRHPQNAACAPKLHSWYERDTFEYAGAAGGLLDAYGYPFCRGRVMKKVEKDEGQYDSPADVFWASGACLMVRSSVWKELGGLDERFFAHMEEIDFCWRAQLAGWKISVVPEALVYHIGGGTLPSDSEWKLRLNFRNNLLMLENNLSKSYVLCGLEPAAAYRKAKRLITKRMALDLCSAAVFFLTGRADFCRAVVSAHAEYRKMRGGAGLKEVREYTEALADKRIKIDGWYRGWIVWKALTKGKRVFENLGETVNFRHTEYEDCN